MKKIYTVPALRTIDLISEDGILTGSAIVNNGHMNLNDDYVDSQMSNQKDPDLWGNESVWK